MSEPPSANVTVGSGRLLGLVRLSPIAIPAAPLSAPSTGPPTGETRVEGAAAAAAFASASRWRFRCREPLRRNVRPFGPAAAGAAASTSILDWSAGAVEASTAPAFAGVAVASTALEARRSATAIRKRPLRTLPSPIIRHSSYFSAARMRARRRSASESAAISPFHTICWHKPRMHGLSLSAQAQRELELERLCQAIRGPHGDGAVRC